MTTIITETDVNSLVSQAQGLYRKCAYRESLSLCETLYIKGPSNIDNLVLLGSIHFQLRNLSESIFYSQQCLRVDQTCAEAYVTIGNCMKEMGEIHTAISFFHKAIRFQPRFPDAYNNLGCTLFKLGRIHEAIETFNVATSLDESQCDAICNLANIYKATRRPNDAKNEYLRAIKISPQCAIAWSNLGGIFNDSGDFEQSLKCYQHALTIIPEFADAHSNMGNAMRNLGRKTKDKVLIDESSTKHKQAQELRPDFALATGNLALYHIQNKENKKKAEQLLRKASLQDPTFLDSLCNLSAMYFEQGRFDECVKMCLRVIKIKPEHYCAYHNLGNALKEKGMFTASAYAFNTAKSLEVKDVHSQCGVAALLVESGRTEQALRCLHNVSEIDDDELASAIHHNMGVAYTQSMKKNQAEDSYTHQKMVNWENQAVTSYDFSILCQRSGDIDGSISLLQQAQNTQDDRINTATSTMKDFLDAAVCDWSNGLRTWHPLLKPNLTHSYDTDTFNHDGLQILLNTEPKIKVGYVYDAKCSSDIMKIPHMHDLSKFEVFYYPINFHQTYGVADRIFKDNIYLLVLLDESPFSVFDEIFCLRPAPVQISFNLHVTRNIDYFITHDKSSCVASKAIYMPSAFIDIELYNMIPHRASDSIANLRSKYEISEDSFVYASFSQPYKIDEVTFNVWMNILKSTCESSLLLLIRHNGQMEANLKMEAEQRGVNPKRLLFMESCAKFEEHLERYSLVDVFLDTVTHSSKRLICEAVLSGTPMICYNQATEFCNFGQSILGNIGLEDQIVTSLEQYEKLAVGLQFDEEKFIDIVRRLDDKRSSEVGIFNTHSPSRWISSFEQALQSVVER